MRKYLFIFILIYSLVSVALAGWQDDLIGVIGQKNGTLEDFTTYTVQEEFEAVTVESSTKISWVDLDRNNQLWVVKDKGADYFSGDFKHELEIQWSNSEAAGIIEWWELANTVADLNTQRVAENDYIALQFSDENLKLILREGAVTDDDTDAFAFSASTTYYVRIERVGTTVTAKIYSGGFDITLQDTLQVDYTGAADSYRYIYGVNSYDSSQGGNDVDGFTQNLRIY